MGANARRGEIEAVLDGKAYRLCLTLGALAELERECGESDLSALLGRFSSGRLSAADLVRLLGAGLRGGGTAIENDAVGRMTTEGGAAGFARIAAALLAATFGSTEGAENDARPRSPQQAPRAGDFPGTRR